MRFVRQTQTIRVTNFDDRLMIEKKIRKHVTDFYTWCHLRSVKLWQDIRVDRSCWKVHTTYSLRTCTHTRNRFNNQSIDRYLKNLLAPIEEIGYFTYSNNSDIVSLSEALSSLSLMTWQVRRDKRIFFNGSTRGYRLLLSLSDICKDTKASYTRQRKSLNSF